MEPPGWLLEARTSEAESEDVEEGHTSKELAQSKQASGGPLEAHLAAHPCVTQCLHRWLTSGDPLEGRCCYVCRAATPGRAATSQLLGGTEVGLQRASFDPLCASPHFCFTGSGF